jgi:hypothetical protein
MGFSRQMAVAGQSATAPIEEDIAKNLTTGVNFLAKFEPITDLVLAEDLGVDPRSAYFINVRTELNIRMTAGDEILANGTKFELLPKAAPNSMAKVHRIYLAQQLTKKDQS